MIAEPTEGVFPGKVAPDFRLPTLDGGTATLREHRGHRVLINFFASWCEARRAELRAQTTVILRTKEEKDDHDDDAKHD